MMNSFLINHFSEMAKQNQYMKKIILSLFALVITLGMGAQTTSEVEVIRIYSSERTGDAASYPVAEYQNSSTDKYSAELLNGVITIKKTTGGTTTVVETWENKSSVKYRAELQKINVTVDGTDSEGREYVNLGNAGVWAKTNVGADKETDYGDYFAWGETTAFNTPVSAYPQNTSLDWSIIDQNSYYNNTYVATGENKYAYYWNIYKWSSTTQSGNPVIYKYKNSDYKTLEAADDAATVNWNTNWRMPSTSEIRELVDADNANSYQISLNGVAGFRYVKIGDESRYVFLPFAGQVAQQSGVQMNGGFGYYRTNELRTDDARFAWLLYIDCYDTSVAYDDDTQNETYRCVGQSVRPVYLSTPISTTPVSSITLTAATVSVNNSITLTADVQPTTATFSNVIWSSSDDEIATVNAMGVVTGIKAGEVTITATAVDGSGVKGTCDVTVEYVKATVISVNDASVVKGSTQTLKAASFTPSNASDTELTWSSDDTDIATVEASTGLVKGWSVGVATIRATNGNVSTTCKVYVYIPVNSISLDAGAKTIKVGETTKITATISPEDATNQNLTWKSDDESIATVDDNGNVTGVSAGSVWINVSADENAEKCNKCKVTVTASDLLSGNFSVSATKKVQFTKGNLYWDGSAYQFEVNQTDYPTTWNASHVGHFYWSKTASVAYAETYSDASASTDDVLFCAEATPLTVDGTSGYYALTSDEWSYLLGTNDKRNGMYQTNVTVGGVAGCIVIAPDNYSNTDKPLSSTTEYTLQEINSLGLVCLPAAGFRNEESIDNSEGDYWHATPDSEDKDWAGQVYFKAAQIIPSYQYYRYLANSVRLVKSAE